MADSKLVSYEDYSPMIDKGRGGYEIIYIAVHHMAGNLSVETCGNVFHNREASAHYGIDNTGRIAQYVKESDTAWALGNAKRNRQSISIELADCSDDYKVADNVIERCIDLLVDICKRLGWTYLSYTGDMTGDLIQHQFVVSTNCPGKHLASKFPYIAESVTARLQGKPAPTPSIEEDGIIGHDTILALQKKIGAEYQDGDIDGQLIEAKEFVKAVTDNWIFDNGNGSSTIKALQKLIGEEDDGYCGYQTVCTLQKFLNVPVTGILEQSTAKALQRWINEDSPTPEKHTYDGEFPNIEVKESISNASRLNDKAAELAWPYGTPSSKSAYPGGSATLAFKKALDKAYPSRPWGPAPKVGASCDVFVGTCIKNVINIAYPRGLAEQNTYTQKHPEYFEQVSPKNAKNGDIIQYSTGTGGHTCIIVNGKIAEAGYEHYYGKTTNTKSARLSTSGKKWIRVFRLKGSSTTTRYYLENGDKGDEVVKLQEFLVWAGYDIGPYGIDGDFGAGTESAVKALQRDGGLEQDGLFGEDSLNYAKKVER